MCKNNPFVADIDKQLSAMHDAVLVSAENAIKQLKMQLKTVTDMEEKGKQMISSAPKKYIGGLTDERDWRVLNEVYVFLLQKREEAQMSKALRTDIRILTPPLGVKEQSSPVKKNVIAGARHGSPDHRTCRHLAPPVMEIYPQVGACRRICFDMGIFYSCCPSVTILYQLTADRHPVYCRRRDLLHVWDDLL